VTKIKSVGQLPDVAEQRLLGRRPIPAPDGGLADTFFGFWATMSVTKLCKTCAQYK